MAPGDDFHRLWTPHAFSHPSTFDTLTIDSALRDEVRADLLRFLPWRSQNVTHSKEDDAGGWGTGGWGTG
jgi:mitochondrial chaperone BCS1